MFVERWNTMYKQEHQKPEQKRLYNRTLTCKHSFKSKNYYNKEKDS